MNSLTIDLPYPNFTPDNLELFSSDTHFQNEPAARMLNDIVRKAIIQTYGNKDIFDFTTYNVMRLVGEMMMTPDNKQMFENVGAFDSEPWAGMESYVDRVVSGIRMIYGKKDKYPMYY